MIDPALSRANELCRSMTDTQLVAEFSKGPEAIQEVAWRALDAEIRRRELRVRPWNDQSRILLTTAPSIDGFRVVETLEIICAECILGLSFLKDLAASFTDVVGGRSIATERSMQEARQSCMRELRRAAKTLSGDAVIAVAFNYGEISAQGKAMMLIVASGTVVQLARRD